jgi:hypothetical protein
MIILPGTIKRTIVSALNPFRYEDDFTEIFFEKVWFEELPFPIEFCATPFDCERHGVELWFRAMKGEYGGIAVIPKTALLFKAAAASKEAAAKLSAKLLPPPPRMLTHDS